MNLFDKKIKESWHTAGSAFSENSDFDKQSIDKRQTILSSLTKRYLRFSIIGFLLGLLFLINAATAHDHVFSPFIWFVLCGFMEFCAITDFLIFLRLGSIDICSMSVADVMRRVAQMRRLHIIFVCVMLPVTTAFIGYIAWTQLSDPAMVYSIFIGYAIGLAIGVRFLLSFMRDYKSISRPD